MECRLGQPRSRPSRAAEGTPGGPLSRARSPHGARSHHYDPRPRRRRDAGRGHVPRQHRDEGLPQEPHATNEAFAGGWFHSGDLGVLHPDGYIQLKDRSKDIIISGGENISSIEVEDVLYKHPAVSACAVVGKPDEKWGETPCAFLELKPGANVTAEEIITWCRDRLARYKVPATSSSKTFPRPPPVRSRSSICARAQSPFDVVHQCVSNGNRSNCAALDETCGKFPRQTRVLASGGVHNGSKPVIRAPLLAASEASGPAASPDVCPACSNDMRIQKWENGHRPLGRTASHW